MGGRAGERAGAATLSVQLKPTLTLAVADQQRQFGAVADPQLVVKAVKRDMAWLCPHARRPLRFPKTNAAHRSDLQKQEPAAKRAARGEQGVARWQANGS